MPTSSWKTLTDVLDLLMVIKPKPTCLLDIGIGFGKYGFLAKEYLTYWGNRYQTNNQAKIKIDGIEGYPLYVTDLQNLIYDHIFIGNAIEVIRSIQDKQYDVALLIDVLEHFPVDMGMKILEECLRVSTTTIISTPIEFEPQQEAFGNPLERHLSVWDEQMLKAAGAVVVRNSNDQNWVSVFTTDKIFIKQYKDYAKSNTLVRKLLRLILPYRLRRLMGRFAHSIATVSRSSSRLDGQQ